MKSKFLYGLAGLMLGASVSLFNADEKKPETHTVPLVATNYQDEQTNTHSRVNHIQMIANLQNIKCETQQYPKYDRTPPESVEDFIDRVYDNYDSTEEADQVNEYIKEGICGPNSPRYQIWKEEHDLRKKLTIKKFKTHSPEFIKNKIEEIDKKFKFNTEWTCTHYYLNDQVQCEPLKDVAFARENGLNLNEYIDTRCRTNAKPEEILEMFENGLTQEDIDNCEFLKTILPENYAQKCIEHTRNYEGIEISHIQIHVAHERIGEYIDPEIIIKYTPQRIASVAYDLRMEKPSDEKKPSLDDVIKFIKEEDRRKASEE